MYFLNSLYKFFVVVVLIKTNEGSTIEELNNSTLATINKFLNETNSAVQDATQTSIKLITDIDSALMSVIDNIKGQVNNTMNEINRNIRTAVDQSGGIVGKITNCTDEYSVELSNFQSLLLNNMTGCISDKIQTASATATNVIKATANLSNIAVQAIDKIGARCPQPNPQDIFGFFGYSLCVTYAVSELASEVTQNIATITINVATGSILIASLSNLPLDLTTCFSVRTGFALLNSAPLVGKIVQCTLTPS